MRWLDRYAQRAFERHERNKVMHPAQQRNVEWAWRAGLVGVPAFVLAVLLAAHKGEEALANRRFRKRWERR
jgi:hypothetical protein